MSQSVTCARAIPSGSDSSRAGGFTLTELMIVVAVIGLLLAIAIPNYVHARQSTQVRACITNLRKLDDIKSQWALEYKKADTAIPLTADITPYLEGNHLPICPASGTYRLRRISRPPVCSLSPIGHTLSNLNMDDDALAD